VEVEVSVWDSMTEVDAAAAVDARLEFEWKDEDEDVGVMGSIDVMMRKMGMDECRRIDASNKDSVSL